MKYTLKEIKGGIFLVEFDNQYDLAMTFLRYQEFYESPKFKGKRFTIIDFMEWYSKEYDGAFTYTKDWVGFNIPVSTVFEVYDHSLVAKTDFPIKDWNKYDDIMKKIVLKITNKKGTAQKLYLIGTVKGNAAVMKHELAHGFYHVYPFYKMDMDKLYHKLSKKSKQTLEEKFKSMGYHKSVWKDEAQAYLSTGEYLTPGERKPFMELFKKFETSKNNIS